MPLSFFTLVFCLELETREGIVVQRVHLHIWPVRGHRLGELLEQVPRILILD